MASAAEPFSDIHQLRWYPAPATIKLNPLGSKSVPVVAVVTPRLPNRSPGIGRLRTNTVSERLPLVAVIVATPPARKLNQASRPDVCHQASPGRTTATLVSLLAHSTVGLRRTLPLASRDRKSVV